MKMSIVRFTALFTASAFLFVLSVMALSGQIDHFIPSILSKDSLPVNNADEKITVILDAGHGGEDGGASGLNDTLEKDLNLQLTLRTKDLLTACGYNVLLTRDEDIMLGNGETGHKKLEDLRYRLDFSNGHPEALLISIHMNKFPMEYCKGVQLYYSANNDKSLPLATSLHHLIKEKFQQDNTREIKKATGSIYLLDRVQIPAILIECGFLSNSEESQLLKDETYQKKLSLLILAALNDYFAAEDGT